MSAPLRTITWSEHASRTYIRRGIARQALRPIAKPTDEESILRARIDSLCATGSREARTRNAREIGGMDGLGNRHSGRDMSAWTGGEILAWLEGWREGQVEFKSKQAEISRLREEIGRL